MMPPNGAWGRCSSALNLCTLVFALGQMLVSAAQAQSSWSVTRTHMHPTAGARFVASVADSETLHIVVGLKLRNPEQVARKVAALTTPGNPEFKQWLTPAQALSDYAPLPERVQAVADYLSLAGFTDIRISSNRLLVAATGPASAVRSAFNTDLAHFSRAGRDEIANTKDASVPEELGDVVLSVLGLQTLDRAQTLHTTATQGVITSHNPVEFPSIYNAAGLPSASNTVVGIIAEGDLTQTLADLARAQAANGLPAISTEVIQTGYGPWTDTSNTDEWDLDSQVIQAMAGGTVQELRFYASTSLLDSDLTWAFAEAANENVAKVINVSLGIAETAAKADGSISIDDEIFQEAVMFGNTFVAASGDHGAYECGTVGPNGSFGTQLCDWYPASSPDVVAVGGTTLSTGSFGVYAGETAWTYGGGGPSLYEPQFYQAGSIPGTTRGVPDVAFDADPNTGALIYVDGTLEVIGGTSLAAPIFTGGWARLQTAYNNALGHPISSVTGFYVLAADPGASSIFHDVTSGSNGYYSAAPGWDYTTGLGSVNFGGLNTALINSGYY